jgi:putative transposase
MILSFKTQLKTDNFLNQFLQNACNVRRYCYNHSLHIWKDLNDQGEKPNASIVRNEFRNRIKEDTSDKYTFLKKYPNMIFENAIDDLDIGFKAFFKKKSKHFPCFQKRGKSVSSFRIHKKNETTFKIVDGMIRIPKLPNDYLLRLHEELPSRIKDIRTVTISKKTDKWYISISYEVKFKEYKQHDHENVGIDLGIKTFATTSKEEKFFIPRKKILKLEAKISRIQSELSKKVKYSNHYKEIKEKLQKLYMYKKNILTDYLHKLSTYICQTYKNICIEDLNVAGMLKNHKLSKSIIRSSWTIWTDMIKYKVNKFSCNLMIADRFFPSSKICACCSNVKKDLKLSNRVYVCDECGHTMDRDLNASMNLEALLAT